MSIDVLFGLSLLVVSNFFCLIRGTYLSCAITNAVLLVIVFLSRTETDLHSNVSCESEEINIVKKIMETGGR